MNFQEAFRHAQDELGLRHFAVAFAGEPGSGNYATCEADSPSCTALVRVNEPLCESTDDIEATAVHECLHLLLSDFKHAMYECPDAAAWQEEQVVRRLEPLVYRALFSDVGGDSKPDNEHIHGS